MAIFDITASNVYKDYSYYALLSETTKLSQQVVVGKTENAKTITQITAYIGDTYSFINELIY